MRLIYLDESGTTAKATFLSVAGVIIHGDEEWPEVGLNATFANISHGLARTGVNAALLTLQGDDIDDSPHLPTGRSYRVAM